MLKKAQPIKTYNDLLKILLIFNENQLNMPIQIAYPEDLDNSNTIELFANISIGTMEQFRLFSAKNKFNKYLNEDEVVILTENNR